MKRKKKPAALVYDPTFRYTRSDQQGDGYLKAKFARIAAEMAESKRASEAEQGGKVRKLGGAK